MTEEVSKEKNKVENEVIDDLFLSPDDSIVSEKDGASEVGTEIEGVDVKTEVDIKTEVDVAVSEVVEDPLAALQEELVNVQKERDDFKNRMLRAAADLENFRRRANKEKEDLRKYGIEKLAGELLPVVDNFERALEHAEKDASSFLDGVQMIYKQFIGAMEKHGVVGFEAVGEKFLPQLHEAIQQIETLEYESGSVVEQFQKGYNLHDRLMRAALVSVAKAPSEVVTIDENISEVNDESASEAEE